MYHIDSFGLKFNYFTQSVFEQIVDRFSKMHVFISWYFPIISFVFEASYTHYLNVGC